MRNLRHTAAAFTLAMTACGGAKRDAAAASKVTMLPAHQRTAHHMPSEVRFVTPGFDTVAFTEDLRIGSHDAPFEFGQVNIILPMADGGIVVVDSKSPRNGALLFRFDSAGQFVGSIGRIGAGPGEFSALAIPVRLADGRLLISDAGNARFTIYDVDGAPLESTRAPTNLGGTGVTQAADSGWYAEADDYSAGPAHPPLRLFIHYSRKGRIIDTVLPPKEYLDGPSGGDLLPDSRVAILPDGSPATAITNALDVTVHRPHGPALFQRQAVRVTYLAAEAVSRTAMIPVKSPGLPAAGQPKPTFHRMRADQDGRLLLAVDGPGYIDSTAANSRDPRRTPWRSAFWLDVVDPVHGYLGRVIFPIGTTYGAAAISGRSIWLKVLESDGTNTIARVTPDRVVW